MEGDANLLDKLIPAVVPGLLGVLRTTSVSRAVLAQTLRQLAADIRAGEHIPDTALAQARADGTVLDRLLAGKT